MRKARFVQPKPTENPKESEKKSIPPSFNVEDAAKFYATVNHISTNMRKADWTYLCRHPEIRAIIRVILTEAIKQEPTNIFKFTSDLFECSNNKQLVKLINKQLRWVNEQLKSGAWTEADGEMLFSQSSDHSFSSKKFECPQNFAGDQTGGNAQDGKPSAECLFTDDLLACPENFKPSCKEEVKCCEEK